MMISVDMRFVAQRTPHISDKMFNMKMNAKIEKWAQCKQFRVCIQQRMAKIMITYQIRISITYIVLQLAKRLNDLISMNKEPVSFH